MIDMKLTHEQSQTNVGEFFIAPGIQEGKVWIGRLSGARVGEGGDFGIEKLEEVIRKFYEENF